MGDVCVYFFATAVEVLKCMPFDFDYHSRIIRITRCSVLSLELNHLTTKTVLRALFDLSHMLFRDVLQYSLYPKLDELFDFGHTI